MCLFYGKINTILGRRQEGEKPLINFVCGSHEKCILKCWLQHTFYEGVSKICCRIVITTHS